MVEGNKRCFNLEHVPIYMYQVIVYWRHGSSNFKHHLTYLTVINHSSPYLSLVCAGVTGSTLLKKSNKEITICCNKNVDIKLVRTTPFWNNLHQVRSKSKYSYMYIYLINPNLFCKLRYISLK